MKNNAALNWLRWTATILIMFGTAPVYFAVWLIWRCISLASCPDKYTYGDDILYSLYQKLVLFFFVNCAGIKINWSGDCDKVFKRKENIIFMSNHQCTVDWMIVNMLAIRQGSIGHIRYVLKNSLKYLPLYGFYFKQHSCVYVRRSGQFHKDQAQQQLDCLAQKTTPFWMVVFPEGTRFNPELPDVIEKSQKFAQSHAQPVLHKVLTPRPKALFLCVSRLQRRLHALYDVTVAYSSTRSSHQRTRAPSLSEFLSGTCGELHINIKRIPAEDIPLQQEDFNRWLVDRFVEKEKLLDAFYSTGHLSNEEENRESTIPLLKTLPSLFFWLTIDLPLWLTPIGRCCYAVMLVAGLLTSFVWALFLS